jgi:hypothetical protein
LLLSVFVSDDEWLKGSNFFYGHFQPESRKFRNKDETKKAYRNFFSIDNIWYEEKVKDRPKPNYISNLWSLEKYVWRSI